MTMLSDIHDQAVAFDPEDPSPWQARVHPADIDKLRDLVYLLMDISDGRLMSRDPVLDRVETLMAMTRGDCSSEGADEVVDRLLAIPVVGLSGDAISEIALDIIRAYPAWPRVAVNAWGVRLDHRKAQGQSLAVLGPANAISIIGDAAL